MLAALDVSLFGRAKTGCAELIAEFKEEGDCKKAVEWFKTAQYDSIQEPMTFFQYLKRQVSTGLPDANEVTIKLPSATGSFRPCHKR